MCSRKCLHSKLWFSSSCLGKHQYHVVGASHHIPSTLTNWKHVKSNIWSSTPNWNGFQQFQINKVCWYPRSEQEGESLNSSILSCELIIASETASVVPWVWCLPPQILPIPSLPFILMIRASLEMSAPRHAYPTNYIYSSFSQLLSLPFSLELQKAIALKCLHKTCLSSCLLGNSPSSMSCSSLSNPLLNVSFVHHFI